MTFSLNIEVFRAVVNGLKNTIYDFVYFKTFSGDIRIKSHILRFKRCDLICDLIAILGEYATKCSYNYTLPTPDPVPCTIIFFAILFPFYNLNSKFKKFVLVIWILIFDIV